MGSEAGCNLQLHPPIIPNLQLEIDRITNNPPLLNLIQHNFNGQRSGWFGAVNQPQPEIFQNFGLLFTKRVFSKPLQVAFKDYDFRGV